MYSVVGKTLSGRQEWEARCVHLYQQHHRRPKLSLAIMRSSISGRARGTSAFAAPFHHPPRHTSKSAITAVDFSTPLTRHSVRVRQDDCLT